MNSLEEVRQVIVAEFKAVHDSSYPTVPVNYENFAVVDIEHQREPFVSIELSFDNTELSSLGSEDIFVTGLLSVTYYYQEGRGGQGNLEYSDVLNANLCLRVLNGIYYSAVKPYKVVTFPGWIGRMNMIKFTLDPTSTCV